MAAECSPCALAAESALATKPHHYDYPPRPPAHASVQRHWPRAVSALVLRLQLQLRHRLGVTVALPAVPLPRARLSLSASPPSAPTAWLPGPHRLPHLRRPRLRLRTVVCALLLVPPLLLALVLLYGGVPPSYADVRRREWALPQHHWRSTNTRTSAAERGARSTSPTNGDPQETYLRFPDHVWGHGLNNVLQEAILTTHLTLSVSARTPVFEPYTWSRLTLPYTLYDFALRPTRVPLSAFVGGVLAGAVGVESGGDDTNNGDTSNATTRRTRRAVSAAYFEHVCAPTEVVEVVYGLDAPERDLLVDKDEDAYDTTNSSVPINPPPPPPTTTTPYRYPHPAPAQDADGRAILAWFARRLRAPDVRGARCVVVREDPLRVSGARRVFDADFFGAEKRIGPVLAELLASPVLRGFAWSPLVDGAVERSVRAAFGFRSLLNHDADANTNPNSNSNPNSKIEIHAETVSRPTPSTTHPEADNDEYRKDEYRKDEYRKDQNPKDEQDAEEDSSGDDGMLTGVLALHLRRGDYGRHCVRLARWGATYLGVNGALRDSFDPFRASSGSGDSDAGAEQDTGAEEDVDGDGERYYLEHCLPSIEQAVRRLRAVRAEYEAEASVTSMSTSSALSHKTTKINGAKINATAREGHERRLKHVYVLTNGWPAFVDALRGALLADGWERVVATGDLERGGALSPSSPPSAHSPGHPDAQPGWGARVLAALSGWAEWGFPVRWGRADGASVGEGKWEGLTREERGVAVAVDMALAKRAEVFVGNGFSSLSANIVLLRMARGLGGGANRLL